MTLADTVGQEFCAVPVLNGDVLRDVGLEGLGLQADFNYTYAKSLDTTSQAERLGASGGINNAQIMNTWSPNELYGASDFDIRHQMNANYTEASHKVWSAKGPLIAMQSYAGDTFHI